MSATLSLLERTMEKKAASSRTVISIRSSSCVSWSVQDYDDWDQHLHRGQYTLIYLHVIGHQNYTTSAYLYLRQTTKWILPNA